jgi:coproporphyrinogen III oxidase-like Fe-S oxidoreductase
VAGDIQRLRVAGISNINVDLIAGLPHQTASSWEFSVAEAIASGVPHVSVYMLEVDEDSRLGREVLAGGTRYHAHFVPDEDLTADFYGAACEKLNAAGVQQYEISNFARAGFESKHNLKYWTRQPYMGFGVDAHSMLRAGAKAPDLERVVVGMTAHASPAAPAAEIAYDDFCDEPAEKTVANESNIESSTELDIVGNANEIIGVRVGRARLPVVPQKPEKAGALAHEDYPEAIRFSCCDSLEGYVRNNVLAQTMVSRTAALEETFFLGLRLNRGVDLAEVRQRFVLDQTAYIADVVEDLVGECLLVCNGSVIALTARGRLLSNEVFERFLASTLAK